MNRSRLLWEPAIYEHKAALIGRRPGQVARSADLLTEAVLVEHEVYRADFVTVGIDVYNVEAEACGGEVVDIGAESCPDLAQPPFDLDSLPQELDLPTMNAGRFAMLLEAGKRVSDAIGDRCGIRIAASGPASIAAKLVGLEKLIMAMAMGEAPAGTILAFSAALSEAWCRCIGQAGLEAIVFDSVVAPPMISPEMYRESILPLHKRLLSLLAVAGQNDRPLIVGGDTTALLGCLAQTGATTVICDFTADAEAFAAAIPADCDLQVRRNVDPRVLAAEPEAISRAANRLVEDLRFFERPIAGTGILPYDTDPEKFRILRNAADSAWR